MSTKSNYSPAVIDAVMAMMDREFTKRCILSHEARLEVCIRLLDEEEIMAEAERKYDLATLFSGGNCAQAVVEEEPGKVMHVYQQLTAKQQAALVRNNRDFRLEFDPCLPMAHAYGAAQRGIDTQRCLRACNTYDGAIGDFGGNYSTHHRAGRVGHSCTLVEDVRNLHRNIERDVNLHATYGADVQTNHCTVGAQRCDVQFTQAISVHTLPDIPVGDWPDILDRHGVEHVMAVFHFDNMLFQSESGKLPDCDMEYYREGENVVFHFSEDSSFGYSHNWVNLQKYAVPWALSSTKTGYTYLYEILHSGGGVITAEINRVETRSLGRQVARPMYAYIPNDEWIDIESCVRDTSIAAPETSAAAYVRVTVRVPREFYEFLSMYAMAVDQKDFNKDNFVGVAMTYNSTRAFGNTFLTGKHVLSELEVGDMIDCVWHYVCWLRANNTERVKAMNRALISKQRVPGIPSMQALALVPVSVAVAPFVLAGDCLSHYTRAFAAAWRRLVTDRMDVPKQVDVPMYVKLPTSGVGNFNGYFPGSSLVHRRGIARQEPLPASAMFELWMDKVDKVDVVPTPSVAKPEEDDVSTTTTTVSQTSVSTAATSVCSDVVTPVVSVKPREDVTEPEYEIDLNCDVHKLFAGRFRAYAKYYAEFRPSDGIVRDGLSLDEVHRDGDKMMLESALYHLDVGNGVLRSLVDLVKSVAPGGYINGLRVDNQNYGNDAAIRFFEINAGYAPEGLKDYMICIDVKTQHILKVYKSKDGKFAEIREPCSGTVMVDKTCVVFNSYGLALNVLKLLDKYEQPDCEMELRDDVPGSGKTTAIVNAFTMNDVVVSTVKDSRDDTFERLKKLGVHNGDEKSLMARVRTNHSVTLNGFNAPGGCDVLFADEGLMEFPGIMCAMIAILKPRVVKTYGDSEQIGAIDRSPSMGVLMYSRILNWTRVIQGDTSLSMPGDVCVILSRFYRRIIKTKSPVRRSLRVLHVTDVSHPAYTVARKGHEYMSVLTADRAKLISARGFVDGKKAAAIVASGGKVSGSRVFSVHEAQGQRFDRSNVVRMNPNTVAVLNSKSHIIVAMSRHYYSCDYTTLVADDQLAKAMNTPVSEAELDAVMLPSEPWMIDRIDRIKNGVN